MVRHIRLRRVYDDPSPKDAAPSTPLRRWHGHRPERFTEFRRRYLAELFRETP